MAATLPPSLRNGTDAAMLEMAASVRYIPMGLIEDEGMGNVMWLAGLSNQWNQKGCSAGSSGLKLVGTPRFELGTPCTPCKCATRLRHVPPEKLLKPAAGGRRGGAHHT